MSVSSEEVASIAHDLKGPLANIELGLEVIAVTSERQALMRELERIRRNARYMDRLVQDLLDLPRVEEGSLPLERRQIALSRVVRDAVERVVPPRDRRGVALVVDTDAIVDIDPVRIERVVANLVANALKYTPPGSPIDVAVQREDVVARVSVSDAGPGIRPGDAPYVFERYRRGSASAGTEGSGLGLYVSKRIVEAHAGRMGFEALPIGARFYFELPVARCTLPGCRSR